LTESYKKEYEGLSAVAIKIRLGEPEVRALGHITFSDENGAALEIACDESPKCLDIFIIGYPKEYPDIFQPLVNKLKKILAEDHKRGASHATCIPLPRYGN
jgi:hypothetical protein